MSLDLIDLPSDMGSIAHPINLLHNNGTSPKLRRTRECQLKKAGSLASDVRVPVTAHGKAQLRGVASSSSSSHKVPVTAHGKACIPARKRKATKEEEKKMATSHTQKSMQKTAVSLSTTSSRSLLDDCKKFANCKKLANDFTKKKNYDFRELFALPKQGHFSQREVNVGYVDALLQHVKTHEDADEAIR